MPYVVPVKAEKCRRLLSSTSSTIHLIAPY